MTRLIYHRVLMCKFACPRAVTTPHLCIPSFRHSVTPSFRHSVNIWTSLLNNLSSFCLICFKFSPHLHHQTIHVWYEFRGQRVSIALVTTPCIRLVKFQLVRQIPDVYVSACVLAGKLFCCIFHRIPKLFMILSYGGLYFLSIFI